jgi:hypothetical protein
VARGQVRAFLYLPKKRNARKAAWLLKTSRQFKAVKRQLQADNRQKKLAFLTVIRQSTVIKMTKKRL